MKNIKCYSDLITYDTFLERYNYLKIGGQVGIETFGFDRYLNQALYRSKQWRSIRDYVIIRDNGCDLGIEDREIYGRIIIHHMNPISEEQILNKDPVIFDPEFLICVSINTHNAIHYSDESILFTGLTERKINDTRLW